MVIALICLIAVLCAALLIGFQAGVFEKDKTKASADLSTRGVQTDGDSGSGSLTSPKLPKEAGRRTNKPNNPNKPPNKPVSQITTPDLQSGGIGSTIDAETDKDSALSESTLDDYYLPGPDSIFTVKSSKRDPLAKQVFSLKRLDAFIIQQLLPEYAGYSVDDIIRLAINSVVSSSGFGNTEHLPTAQIEIVSPGNSVVRTDVRFFAKHAPAPKAKKKFRFFRKKGPGEAKKSQENRETEEISPLDILLFHVEPQNADYLDQVLLNRAQLTSAADLFGQLEPSGNMYRKFRDVSDVIVIWIIFSKEPLQQNRILSRETSMTVRYDNNYHLVQEAKTGSLKGLGMGSDKDSGDLAARAKKIREKTDNPSWPFETGTKKSLVTEWFIILGDPNSDFVEEYSPLLYVLDTIFSEDMDSNEKLRILRKYGIVKNEKEANIMSYTVTGSPFLVSMGDLQQKNAHQAQKIASLEEELAAAYRKIDSLEQGKAESKKS